MGAGGSEFFLTKNPKLILNFFFSGGGGAGKGGGGRGWLG